MNRWIVATVIACLAATAIPAARPTTPLPHPTLLETSDTVELTNSQISLVIDKATGQILSWRLVGGPDVLTTGKTIYFDANGGGPKPSPRKAGTRRMTHPEYRLVRNDKDFIEVAFAFAGDEIFPFDTELHYILRPGDSGVYCFVVYRHGPDAPRGSLGQTRLVIKLKRDLFTHYFVNDQTQGEFPKLADPNAKLTPVTDATVMFPGGRIATKYNLADFEENHHVHGVAGPAGGVWVISASNEYLNGGPTKQDLQVHEDDVIVLKMLHSGHFLIRTAMDFPAGAGAEWTKLYGPFFLYLNRAATPQAAWEDAKARARQEQAAWPYAWMDHPAYPHDRGQVAGRLMIQGRTPAANACVILAAGDSDWQIQGKGYIFWTRTANDGTFNIPHVRPGQYTLYAFMPGQAGELRRDGVSVDAGKTAALGQIDFRPLTYGRTLWQIGTPDRTCGEFRYGGLPRQFGLWNKYLADFPDDVTFHVGQSREKTDWNYCQPVVQKPDGSWHCPTWRVVFDSPAAQTGKAVLMIGIAGAVREPELVVRVNDAEIGRQKLSNDGSVYRDATLAGQYRLWTVEFDASLLKQGRNVLSLELVKSNPTDAGYDPLSLPRAAIMYDFLRLEVAP